MSSTSLTDIQVLRHIYKYSIEGRTMVCWLNNDNKRISILHQDPVSAKDVRKRNEKKISQYKR